MTEPFSELNPPPHNEIPPHADCELIQFPDLSEHPQPAKPRPTAPRRSEWPNPDLSILHGGDFPIPAFPESLLSDRLASIIHLLAEAKGASPDYVFAGVLSGAASLIGNAYTVQSFSGWREPVALWTCLVGGPSAGKTPALNPIVSILKSLEDSALPVFKERLAQWQEGAEVAAIFEKNWKAEVKAAIKIGEPRPDKPDAATPPPEPFRPRRMLSDVTQEKAAQLLSQTPKGLCLFRDELAGLIEGCGKYGNDSDRQFFLEAWNGNPFTVDRVNRSEPLRIDRLLLSIVGGIQPDRLNSLFLNVDNDGLASRFLFVWPESMPPVRPNVDYDLNPLKRAFERLDGLDLHEREEGFEPAVIRLAEDANSTHQAGREWLYQNFKDAPGLFGSFTGKIPGMAMRLAAVLDLLDWAIEGQYLLPSLISTDTIDHGNCLSTTSSPWHNELTAMLVLSKPNDMQKPLPSRSWIAGSYQSTRAPFYVTGKFPVSINPQKLIAH